MDGEPGGGMAFREPLLADRLTHGQRLAVAVAWSVGVAALAIGLVWATQDLVQWDNSDRARHAQGAARWIVLATCAALGCAGVVAHRVLGSRMAAALTGGVAAAVLILAWLPIPFGAFIAAGAGCYALLAAIVVALVTSLGT